MKLQVLQAFYLLLWITSKKKEIKFTHFDRHLAELTSQKNTLSYENGKLQSEVEQLQGELTSVKANHRDVEKVQKNLKQAETKIRKVSNLLVKLLLSQSCNILL